jgi:hypothetical protein
MRSVSCGNGEKFSYILHLRDGKFERQMCALMQFNLYAACNIRIKFYETRTEIQFSDVLPSFPQRLQACCSNTSKEAATTTTTTTTATTFPQFFIHNHTDAPL